MIEWRIYYDDGSTFSNLDGDHHDAPGYGVVAIVQPCPDRGRVVVAGWNFYYHCGGTDAKWQWWGSNQMGTLDQFIRFSRHRSALKLGAHSSRYNEILVAAMEDTDFPLSSSPTPLKPVPRGSLVGPDAQWGD